MDVTIEQTIRRPRSEVAAFVTDHRNDTTWIGGIQRSELLGDPPLAEGSEVLRVASFLGRRIEYVLRIERMRPDEELAMRSVRAPFPMTVVYGFADHDGGTRVSIHTDLTLSGTVAQSGRMVEAVSAQLVQSFADCLKAQLVGSDAEAAAAVATQSRPVSGQSLALRALIRRLRGVLRRRS
jgi:carbon monoxide dehydrogenase subunit G